MSAKKKSIYEWNAKERALRNRAIADLVFGRTRNYDGFAWPWSAASGAAGRSPPDFLGSDRAAGILLDEVVRQGKTTMIVNDGGGPDWSVTVEGYKRYDPDRKTAIVAAVLAAYDWEEVGS